MIAWPAALRVRGPPPPPGSGARHALLPQCRATRWAHARTLHGATLRAAGSTQHAHPRRWTRPAAPPPACAGGDPPARPPNSTSGWRGGGGDDGGGGGGGSNSQHGGQPPWRTGAAAVGRALACAAGAFVVLGLLQPWRALSGLPAIDTSQQTVTIVIPVLNEAAAIAPTLERLRQLQPPAAEVIVVDGGSTDGTAAAARRSGLADRVLRGRRGRAAQMNSGADAARGDLLCFLHADTAPPRDLVAVMRRELRDPHTVLAGFVPSIEVPGRRLWLLSLHNFISTYYAPLLFRPLSYLRGLRGLFGDQTMFCRRCDFRAVGGFDPRWAIMEDTDLCVRMHDAGPCTHHARRAAAAAAEPELAGAGGGGGCEPAGGGWPQAWRRWQRPRGRVRQVLDRVSVTSGRRLAAWGPLRATYIHLVIGTAWYFQRDPQQLRRLYDRMYTDAFR